MDNKYKIPVALFNSKALFNPYQYLPFEKIMEWKNDKYVWNGNNLLIADEVGVGKTFEAGIILRELLSNNPKLRVLIICPVKLCENWVDELHENFYITPVNYWETKTFGKITVVPYSAFSNSKTKKMDDPSEVEKELIEDRENGNIDSTVINSFSKLISQYDVLILDEAHYVRNKVPLWESINELISLCEAPNGVRIFMTGTPIFNKDEDYNNLTELLKMGSVNNNESHSFESTTTLQGEANCYDHELDINFVGIKNEKYEPGAFIQPNEEEKRIYEEISKVIEQEDPNYEDDQWYYEDWEDDEVHFVSKYGRQSSILMRLSSSSFYSLREWVKEYKGDNEKIVQDLRKNLDLMEYTKKNDSKLKALKELFKHLKNNPAEGEKTFKAIIFTCFHLTCNYLETQLNADYVVRTLTGKTKAKDVSRIKDEFQKPDKDCILICTDAAKEGHNFQFCHYLIHYDLPFTPSAIGQRNGRIYRRGQKNTPQSFYMLLGDGNDLFGYDYRLFGEIIMEKCGIVRKASELELVPHMNILPNDSENLLENYYKKYFEKKMEEKEEDPVKRCITEARRLLRKKFSSKELKDSDNESQNDQEEDIKWRYFDTKDDVKNFYDELKKSDINWDEVYKELLDILKKDFCKNKDLSEFYKKEYDFKMWKFIKEHFGYDDQAIAEDESSEWFVKCCEEYLSHYGLKDAKYCHYFIKAESDGKTKDIEEYKDSFVPLQNRTENKRDVWDI